MADDVTKRCSKCGEVKPLDAFGPRPSARDGHRSQCKACESQYQQRYYEAHGDRARAASRRWYEANKEAASQKRRQWYEANQDAAADYHQQRCAELRALVFGHYGTVCACCGTGDDLTIDHVNGGGSAHRRGIFGRDRVAGARRFYDWLVRNGFPAGYQTLCARCNQSKGTRERCGLDHS